MRNRLTPVWISGLLAFVLLILSACTAQSTTLTSSPTPTDNAPGDQGQLQFIEFYSPF